jgi:hypothetical protein
MLFPLLVAAGSVALGAALAAVPAARRALGPVRMVVLLLALGVALASLIPSAWRGLGALSLLGVIAGFVVPLLVERGAEVASTRFGPASRLSSAVTFAALFVHQVGDGLGLYAVQASVEVAFALAAHTVPITALVVLDAFDAGEKWAAVLRAALLATATAVGVLLGSIVPAALVASVEPWISAVVAGLLLHIVLHDARHRPPAA